MNLPPKVTERAFSRLSEINASAKGQALRVAVEGGGCSGFQYEIKLDTAQDDDLVLGSGPEKVIIDSASLPFLENAVIDFSIPALANNLVQSSAACWPTAHKPPFATI